MFSRDGHISCVNVFLIDTVKLGDGLSAYVSKEPGLCNSNKY